MMEVSRLGTSLSVSRGSTLGPALQRRRRLRAGITQLFYVVFGYALGQVVPRIDVGFTVESARAVDSLLAVGAGIVTFIGVVYSLLFLVIQFGTSNFTARLNLFRDAPIVWHAFGYFTGVLVFSFTAAFSAGKDSQISGLVPIVLVVVLIAAVGVFRSLQVQAFESIQLASALAQLVERGHQVIRNVYPVADEHDPATNERRQLESSGLAESLVWRGRQGVLQRVDVPRLLQTAEQGDLIVELLVRPGDVIYEGDVVAIVHPQQDRHFAADVLKAFTVGVERTFEQDPALALRVLSDIGLRGLSSEMNDPTTAVQVLDGLDGLLRALATRDLDLSAIADEHGAVRLVLKLPTWDDYVAVALDEIVAEQPQLFVAARLERLLDAVAAKAPPERQSALERRRLTLRAGYRG